MSLPSTAVSPVPQPAGLRLFNPESLSKLTLRAAFETFLLPDLIEEAREASTIAEYWSAIRHWEKRTVNPPLDVVDGNRKLFKTFFARLREDAKRPTTIRKIWRHLRPILRRCAPESDRNPDGEGLIQAVPKVKLPKVPRQVNRVAERRELSAIYDACDAATWRPAGWWRAAEVCFYNLGPRCWDLFCADQTDAECSGWRWSQISFARKVLKFTQDKTDDEIEIPLNDVVLSHLEALRPLSKGTALFAATKCRGDLYDDWKRIKQAAGVLDLDIQDLRRTCQTEFDWIKPGLGDFMTGHTPQGVGETYYRNFAKKARRAVKRLPQPKAFMQIFQRPDRQRRLFD